MKFVPLKRLVQSARPITYGIVQAGPEVAEGVPYIRPVDMTEHDGCRSLQDLPRTSAEIAAQYRRSSVISGDIVVSIGPSYGKTMIVPDELAGANLTQGTARVSVSSANDARYVRWCLRSAPSIAHWDAAVGGATFRALNLGPLAETPIPLLPLSRQTAIADYLDTETARIDALIVKKQRLSQLTYERWRTHLVTTLGPHLSSGSVPDGWRKGRLRNLVDSIVNGSWGSEPGTASIDAQCVRAADFDFRRLMASSGAPRSYDASDYSGRRLARGELVLEKSGGGDEAPVGRVVMWEGDGPAIPTNFAARMRPLPEHDPWFVLLAFRAAYEAGLNWKALKQTTGIQNLDSLAFLGERWPIPPLAEQSVLSKTIRRRLEQVVAVIDATNQQIELLRERRLALITAAVTGELEIPGAAA